GGLQLSGGLTFLGGDGANDFTINHIQIGGNLTVLGGNNPTGMDVVTINNSVLVGGKTTLSNGPGQSFVEVFDDVDLTGGLTINGGLSDDAVHLSNARLGGPLSVNTGAGTNEVTLAKVFLSGSAFFTAGPGDDRIEMNDVTIGGGVTARLGNGVNYFGIDPFQGRFTSTTRSRIAPPLSLSTGTGTGQRLICGPP